MVRTGRLPIAASGIFILAAVVGGLGGLAGVGFRELLDLLQRLAMGQGGPIVEAGRQLGPELRLIVPTVGGAAAGTILWFLGKRHTPFGISDVMDMVGHRRSHISPWRSLLQVLSSACSLASGGSLGREGAITQLGTTTASVLSRLFREGSRDRVVLMACGTAAGMASSYNAPMAGAIFVMEVILGSFAMEIFAPLVVASVASAVVTGLVRGGEVSAIYESDVALSGGFVFSALVLGVLCGGGGVVFNLAMSWGKRLLQLIPGPPPLRLALGGLAVGAIALWFPQVFGNGQEAIQGEILASDAVLQTLFAVLVFKIVATACTTGSGALGGVFTPTLVVGASCGAFFGLAFESLGFAVERNALALVGMAGICAATTHAPITSVFLIFELTQDYNIILPVMLCSISASLVARTIHGESYYTARQREKSAAHSGGLEQLALEGNSVRDVMRRDEHKVHRNCSFDEVMQLFSSSRRDTVYVVEDDRTLIGRVHVHDIKHFLTETSLRSVVIAADLTRPAVLATPDETLGTLLARFDDPELDELPVVRSLENPTLLGRITRRDVIAVLGDEVLGRRKLRTRFRHADATGDIHVQLPKDAALGKFATPDELAGRTISSFEIPDEVVPLILIEFDSEKVESRRLAVPSAELTRGSLLIVIGTQAGLATMSGLWSQT